MLNYLHDIRNKLTLISGHTMLLSKKYGEEEFIPIKTNLFRISELINDAYRSTSEFKQAENTPLNKIEFVRQLDLLADTMQLLYPLHIKNEVRDFVSNDEFSIEFNNTLLVQVLENALDNSVKASSHKVIIRLLEVDKHCIFELVDDGSGKAKVNDLKDISIIPHGIGKEIMIRNMQKMGGRIEWSSRLDYSGMIVRLYFPKKFE